MDCDHSPQQIAVADIERQANSELRRVMIDRYGTARYVCSRLGKDRFEVVPHVSSMQLASTRVTSLRGFPVAVRIVVGMVFLP